MFYNVLITRVGKVQFTVVHSREVYTFDAWKTLKNTQFLKSASEWKEKKVSAGLVESAGATSGGRDPGIAGGPRPEPR